MSDSLSRSVRQPRLLAETFRAGERGDGETVYTVESVELCSAVSVEYRSVARWADQLYLIWECIANNVRSDDTMGVESWSRQSFCGYVELTVKTSTVGD
jgi:hypothetical protein